MTKQTKVLLSIVGVLAVVALVLASTNSGMFQGRTRRIIQSTPPVGIGTIFINDNITKADFYRLVAIELRNDNGNNNTDPLSNHKDCFLDTKGIPDEGYICYMASKGYVPNYTPATGNFNPSSSINRAEAMQIFWNAYHEIKDPVVIQSNPKLAYNDISGNKYYTYIHESASVGIITSPTPFNNDSFLPDIPLTNGRAQEMIKNLMNVVK
ncbi:MAG: S-layer homology domain-containing protein [Candidatus Peregrinibacteria bacterium]|nr:S-layer homology domain-containing protein [Candidatus Peregrinibacteria bacterium]